MIPTQTSVLIDRLRSSTVCALAVGMSLFHIYTAGTLPFTPSIQLSIHLAFSLTILLLFRPAETSRSVVRLMVDGLLVIAALAPIGWILSFAGEIPPEATAFPPPFAQGLAVALIIVVLEVTRRTIGAALPIVTLLFLSYALLGEHLPGLFGHEGNSLQRMLSVAYYSAQGIYGIPLHASANLIFPLVLFGAFMMVMGSSDVFFQLAIRVTRHVRGGAALACVLASAGVGTVTGSGIANVSSTGVFTIPLMKRIGYRPPMAAAIESAASSGAQLIPPIMGTTAFIMAEILGVSYGTIALAALAPGILYFIAILLQVYLEACRSGIGGVPEAGPEVRQVLMSGWHLLIGPLFLLYLIIGIDMSPGRSAFFSILLVVTVDVVWQLVGERRLRIGRLVKALQTGAITGAGIAAATACIGLIIGALDITGMSIRLGATVGMLAGDNTLLLLVLTAVFCLVLGAGLPTLLAYIVVAVTIAPSLVAAGFSPLAAHMFVFYFAIIADITPPVGVTSVVAARIADAPPMRSALTATRLCLIAWMIPFYFIFDNSILLMGPASEVMLSIGMVFVATVLLAVAIAGYLGGELPVFSRLMIFGCLGVFFIAPTSTTLNLAAIGSAVVVLGITYWWRSSRASISSALDRDGR